MIQANIVGAVQRMDFSTGDITSFAVIEFAGEQKEFEIPFETFKRLVDQVAGRRSRPEPEPVKHSSVPKAAPPKPAPQPVPPPPTPQPAPPPPPQTDPAIVHWPSLPDHILAPKFKRALDALSVPHEVINTELQQLLNSMVEELTAEDWAQFEDPPAPTPEPTPEPAPQAARPSGLQPPTPAVVWNDGTPILPHQARPARTVLADEYGYPIVSNSDVDPGEVVGSGDDVDEDGIGQM
jgi:hypothetical protein